MVMSVGLGVSSTLGVLAQNMPRRNQHRLRRSLRNSRRLHRRIPYSNWLLVEHRTLTQRAHMFVCSAHRF